MGDPIGLWGTRHLISPKWLEKMYVAFFVSSRQLHSTLIQWLVHLAHHFYSCSACSFFARSRSTSS